MDMLLDMLQEYELIFFDTYQFSVGHRDEIKSYLPSDLFYELDRIKAKKILVDGESVANQQAYYDAVKDKFDLVVTPNPKLKGKNVYFTYMGCNPETYPDLGLVRDIDVLYTGSYINRGYRGELMLQLRRIPPKYNVQVHLRDTIEEPEFVRMLNRSKIYLSTYSCANGLKEPMHLKDKEAKALCCGALPLTEDYTPANGYLTPGLHRAVFHDVETLNGTITYCLSHPDEMAKIVKAGKLHVTANYTWENIFIRVLQDPRLRKRSRVSS